MSAIPGNNIVNVADLDTAFPVPGQDNDSQGFRDNFTVIDDNFKSTKARLEDLEANAVRIDRDPSIPSFQTTNVFEDLSSGGTARLIKPTLQAQREVVKSYSSVTGTQIVDFNEGNFHTIGMTGDTTLTFSNVPDSGYYGKFILHITSTGTNNLEFSSSLTLRVLQDTVSPGFFNGTTPIAQGEMHVVEIYTYTGSTEYFGRYIGQYS